MFGTYLAKTSPVEVGTGNWTKFEYQADGETLFEVIDTRGIAKSINEKETSAEEDLKNAIEGFDPDVTLFLLNVTERARGAFVGLATYKSSVNGLLNTVNTEYQKKL